jgi:hypothetical protein
VLDFCSVFWDSDPAAVAERGSVFLPDAVSVEVVSPDFDLAWDSCCPDSDVSGEGSLSAGGVCRVSSCGGLVVLVADVWAQAASASTIKMAENFLMGFISIRLLEQKFDFMAFL